MNVGELVKECGIHEGFDKEWQSYLVDDDKVKRGKLYAQHLFTVIRLSMSSNP